MNIRVHVTTTNTRVSFTNLSAVRTTTTAVCRPCDLAALAKDKENYDAHEDTHDEKEKDVGTEPLVNAEGVESPTFAIVPHVALMDALSHVQVCNDIVIWVGVLELSMIALHAAPNNALSHVPVDDVVVVRVGVLELPMNVGHFPLESTMQVCKGEVGLSGSKA